MFLDETALASPGEIEVEDNTVPPTVLTVKADRPTPIFEKEDLKMVFIEDIMRERTLLEDSVVITLPPLPQIEEDETTVVINPAKDLPTTISIANLPGIIMSIVLQHNSLIYNGRQTKPKICHCHENGLIRQFNDVKMCCDQHVSFK